MKQDTLLFDLLQSLYGLQEHAQLAQAYEYRDTARKFSSYDLLKYWITAAIGRWKGFRHSEKQLPTCAGLPSVDHSTLAKKAREVPFEMMQEILHTLFAVLQSFQNIRIACPHGEAETRKVIGEAVVSPEPYYIRLSRNEVFRSLERNRESSCREIIYQGKERGSSDLCLISVGEQATELCKRMVEANPSIIHAHLVYVDSISLRSYIEELRGVSDRFLVVEEHRGTGGTASYLALMLPECKVYSHDCGEKWPSYGGSHADVLRYLGFGFEELKGQVTAIGGRNGF